MKTKKMTITIASGIITVDGKGVANCFNAFLTWCEAKGYTENDFTDWPFAVGITDRNEVRVEKGDGNLPGLVGLFLSLIFIIICSACGSNDEEVLRAPEVDQNGTPCKQVIETNTGNAGVNISIKAIFKGCYDDVVFKAFITDASGQDISVYRVPSECDTTNVSFSFANKGVNVKIGLFGCGSTVTANGRACKLELTQGSYKTTIDSKIGTVINYTIK